MRISDWSSDVCSSDLLVGSLFALPGQRIPNSRFFGEPGINRGDKEYTALSLLATHEFNDWLSLRSNSRYTWANTEQAEYYLATYYGPGPLDPFEPGTTRAIGRASCRDRVGQYV